MPAVADDRTRGPRRRPGHLWECRRSQTQRVELSNGNITSYVVVRQHRGREGLREGSHPEGRRQPRPRAPPRPAPDPAAVGRSCPCRPRVAGRRGVRACPRRDGQGLGSACRTGAVHRHLRRRGRPRVRTPRSSRPLRERSISTICSCATTGHSRDHARLRQMVARVHQRRVDRHWAPRHRRSGRVRLLAQLPTPGQSDQDRGTTSRPRSRPSPRQASVDDVWLVVEFVSGTLTARPKLDELLPLLRPDDTGRPSSRSAVGAAPTTRRRSPSSRCVSPRAGSVGLLQLEPGRCARRPGRSRKPDRGMGRRTYSATTIAGQTVYRLSPTNS